MHIFSENLGGIFIKTLKNLNNVVVKILLTLTLVITLIGNSFAVHTQDYVNDTFETNGHSYDVNHILKNFNVFSFGDVTGSHINGAVIAKGGLFKVPTNSIDPNIPMWNGERNDVTVSISDFEHSVPNNYSYIQGAYDAVRGLDLQDRLYVGVHTEETIPNTSLGDTEIIQTDNYVNWELAKNSLQQQSIQMLNNATHEVTVEDIYSDFYGKRFIIVKENDNLRISKEIYDQYDYVVYPYDHKPFDKERIVFNYDFDGVVLEKQNVISGDTEGLLNGTVSIDSIHHSLAYDGYHPNGPNVSNDEKTINIIHNYPYAEAIVNLNSMTQRFGQLVAVNATLFDSLGNINGNMIVNALYSHNSEPHFWPPGDDFNVNPEVELYEINGLKIDEQSEAVLAGATISLYTEDYVLLETTTTNIEGKFKFTGLKEGTYIVEETKAPEGYDLGDNKVTVSVGKDMDLVDLIFKNRAIENEMPKDNHFFINGYKRDAKTNETLSGAEITLYNANGDVLETVTTEDDGYFDFSNLSQGKYNVKETKAPEGYLLGNNETEVVFSDTSIPSISLEYFNEKIEDIPSDITYSINGHKIDSKTKDGLSGAHITLFDDNNEVIDVQTTDTDGFFEFTNLKVGKYIVKETRAPEGYLLGHNESIIIFDEQSELSISLVYENEKVEPVIPEEKTFVISGYKFDALTEQALSGAEITLYDEDGNIIHITITDEFGYFEFDNLTEGLYVVEETKAPEGYFLGDNRVEVLLSEENDQVSLIFENYKIEQPPVISGKDPKDPKPIEKTKEDKPVIIEDSTETPKTGINSSLNNILYVSIISASIVLFLLLKDKKRN